MQAYSVPNEADPHHDIRGDDKSVRAGHVQAPPSAARCSRCSAARSMRAARYRLTMKYMSTSSTAMPFVRNPITNSGSTVLGFDCIWCSVRHHFTDMYTMGTLSAPRSPTAALHCARRSASSTNERSARYPTKTRNSTAVDVRRGSHVHQTPQVGRPQMDPNASVSPVNSVPTSAADAARRSCRSSPFHRYSKLAMATTKKAMNAFHADGTCTYMIFCRCPMSLSGGLVRIPSACVEMMTTRARSPNHSIHRPPATAAGALSIPGVRTCDMSDLDHVIKRKERRHQKDHIERRQKLDPGAGVLHRVAGQERRRRLGGREQHGDQHRKEQEREQDLARPAATGHRCVEGPQCDEPNAPQQHYAAGRDPAGDRRHLEQDDGDRNHDDFQQQHEQQVGQELPRENGPAGRGIQEQRLEGRPVEFELVRAIERQDAGEQDREPQCARGGVAQRFGIRPERETKKQQDQDAQKCHGIEPRLGSPLRHEVLPDNRAHSAPVAGEFLQCGNPTVETRVSGLLPGLVPMTTPRPSSMTRSSTRSPCRRSCSTTSADPPPRRASSMTSFTSSMPWGSKLL